MVVGDVDQKTLTPKLGFLKNWSRKEVTLPAARPASKPDKTTVYFVNKDGAAQSEIRMGYLALPYDATGDYYRAYLANYILGGAFNSRINLNLREDKGYTYGARSGYSRHPLRGSVHGPGRRARRCHGRLGEGVHEAKSTNYRKNGITDEELSFLQVVGGPERRLALRNRPAESRLS